MVNTSNQNSSSNPPVNPAVNGNINVGPGVNTGKQYEVNENPPEDLDMMWSRWKCLLCNYTYEGAKPIKKCPRCGNEDLDKFGDAD